MQINTNQFIRYGEFYGYPSCCITSFQKVVVGESPIHASQLKAGQGSGFIPCLECATKVINGICELKDIILPTRKCEGQFPKGHSLKAKVKETNELKLK